MTTTGPDFLALQVRDLEAAAQFFEQHLGMTRAPAGPPGAIVFDTAPIPFARFSNPDAIMSTSGQFADFTIRFAISASAIA